MLQDVNTGRTILMLDQPISPALFEEVVALTDMDPHNPPRPTESLGGLRKSWPDLELIGDRIIVINKPYSEICPQIDTPSIRCIRAGVVSLPDRLTISSDNDTDLYTHLKPIRALETDLTGNGVDVALLDTGFYPHPEFYDRIAYYTSAVKDDADARDRNGHGTHCAGLIVGPRDDESGYGVAPDANLHLIRVLNEDGLGNDEDVLAGLLYAWETVHAKVIVFCCGMPLKSIRAVQAFEKIAQEVRNGGGVVIAPAGNRYEGDPQNVYYPANCASVIAAGAVDRRLMKASFSCAGSANDPVEVTAPGVGIRSGWIDGGHRRVTGTSMAAAITAGVAALIAEKNRLNPSVVAHDLFADLAAAQGAKVIQSPPGR